MQYGPYVSGLQPGNNVATWTLMVDNNSGSQSVVRLDVNDATSNGILAQIYLTRQQWTAANTFQDFTLPFTVNSGNVSDRIELQSLDIRRVLCARTKSKPYTNGQREPGVVQTYYWGRYLCYGRRPKHGNGWQFNHQMVRA